MLDRSRFVIEFDEDFRSSELDPRRWVAHYLPQWTTPDRSAARFELEAGVLRLRIDADQPPWRAEDGEMRVSNLQTGTHSGPLGSPLGPHPHGPDVTVRTPQPTKALYTPSSGLAEAVLRASPDPTCMLAFWLVGFAGTPERSGELCVCELFGDRIGRDRSRVNIGIKAHQDPRLQDDLEEAELDLDQGLAYPQLLLVDLFEFPEDGRRDPAAYPKTAEVAAVRGYRPRGVPR